jgi:hypothetical protein
MDKDVEKITKAMGLANHYFMMAQTEAGMTRVLGFSSDKIVDKDMALGVFCASEDTIKFKEAGTVKFLLVRCPSMQIVEHLCEAVHQVNPSIELVETAVQVLMGEECRVLH